MLKAPARRAICVPLSRPGQVQALAIKKLTEYGVPFIDVGMGLIVKDSTLGGILPRDDKHAQQRGAHKRIPCSETDVENEYDKNIQIADLNALQCGAAVIKWKKVFGFYADNEGDTSSTYSIDCNLLTQRRNLMARQTETYPRVHRACAL